jgi:hypothetical protein
MDISKYNVEIRGHAYEQAIERCIHQDLIEKTLYNGEIKRFGKNYVKFINKGSKRTIICVGEIKGNKLVILTVEEGRK